MASSFMIPNTNPIDATASTSVNILASTPVVKVPKSVEEMVKEYFKNDPIMAKVAWCESRNRQFEKDGVTVFRGKVNNDDVGVMQVNTYYHLKTSQKLGMDIMTLEGNLAYAKYLYDREGTVPWNSSSPCWRSTEVALNTK